MKSEILIAATLELTKHIWLTRRRMLSACVALAALCLPIRAQLTSTKGTSIAIYVARERIIIAADSRDTLPGGKFQDDACKISSFADKVVFTGTGNHHVVGGTGKQSVVWDAYDTALASFRMVSAKPKGKNRELVEAVAQEWESRARQYSNR